MSPSVAAIIVSYNRAADLRLAIESLRACAWPRLRIVVVDNRSRDDSAAVARSFPEVLLVQNRENLGFGAACNLGLERAERDGPCDYIALVNNDAVVGRQWIATLVGCLERHPRAAAAGGRLHFWDADHPAGQPGPYYGHSDVDPMTGQTAPHVGGPDRAREVATLSGAALMVRHHAIADIGLPFLDPLFFLYYEETDFCARAIRRGWQLYYTGDAAAWHRMRASATSSAYHYYMERNRVIYAHRNFSDRGLRSAIRATIAQAARELLNPMRLIEMMRRDGEARARAAAWRWLVANRSLLREQRRTTRPSAVAPFEQLVAAIQSRASYYDHGRPEIAALVPRDAAVVVDVGCGAGALGCALKRERPELRVFGVEAAADPARRAAESLDGVAARAAELGLPEGFPQPDCVIFADVLEHLAEPLEVLKVWRRAMAPRGTVVVSLPNVGHASVLGPLVRGSWRYADAGVLDRTHLRFFTRDTAIELLQQAGFRVTHAGRVADVPPGVVPGFWRGRLRRWAGRVPGVGAGSVRSRLADLCTVQFLLVGDTAGDRP
jgi:GT2 family glycosyltransferase/ubiquinone/menaquinone biosynthesis C-methylase UbiE